MAPNLKLREAFNATRALGIPDEEVKPVLKNLLKLYGKNWALIEEDNYRTLFDAYFEIKENKNDGELNRSTAGQDDSERPPKRLHLENQENQDVSAIKSGALEGDDELLTPSGKFVESALPCLRGKTVLISELLHTGSTNVMKEHSSSHLLPKKEAMTLRAPCSASPKNSRGEAGSNQTQKVDQLNENHIKETPKSKAKRSIATLPDLTEPTVQTAGLRQRNGSSSGNSYLKSVVSSQADMECKGSFSMTNDHSNYECFIDVASSSLGEVKISLNCKPSLIKKKFLMPKLDAVLKFVEEKYRQSLQIVGPQFSASKLLIDLCESYLDLGCDSSQRSGVTEVSSNTIKDVSAGNAGQNAKAIICSKTEFVSNTTPSISSIDLASASQSPCSSDRKKCFLKLVDITKGAEKVKISLVNDSGNEHLPEFNYIPQNIIYQNAHVQISLARIADEDCCSSCIGDCLSSRIPCACTRETGGEFAYTPEGQLKDEFLQACKSMKDNPQKEHLVYCHDCPIERSTNEFKPEKCKGHLLRKFIKECWRKCGCDMHCGNRVVQRGITCNLQVFLTQEGKGWGVRTLEELPKGTFVCEYVGEVVTNMELYDRNLRNNGNERHTYPVMLDADWGSEGHLQDEEALCLDATYHGNVARFINHRCSDANLIDIPVEVETPDRHYYHLAFFTSRKVGAFEELTWDYGIDFDDHAHPVKAFKCCCGSSLCRDMKKKRKLIKGGESRMTKC